MSSTEIKLKAMSEPPKEGLSSLMIPITSAFVVFSVMHLWLHMVYLVSSVMLLHCLGLIFIGLI